MVIVLALIIGLAIGAVMGGLGGGGGILTVPALVYVLGQGARDATAGSLVIVGLGALIGVLGHAKARQVDWQVGIPFGLVGIAGSIAGSVLNRRLDERWLLLGLSMLMLLAAVAMVLDTRRVPAPGAPLRRRKPRARRVGEIVGLGLLVGLLTGLFGIGGGFVIVPVLTVLLHLPMSTAVGTSLLITTINAAASLLARTGQATYDWKVIAPFAVGAMSGTAVGRRIAERVSTKRLTIAFAVMLLAVAVYTVIRSLNT